MQRLQVRNMHRLRCFVCEWHRWYSQLNSCHNLRRPEPCTPSCSNLCEACRCTISFPFVRSSTLVLTTEPTDYSLLISHHAFHICEACRCTISFSSVHPPSFVLTTKDTATTTSATHPRPTRVFRPFFSSPLPSATHSHPHASICNF